MVNKLNVIKDVIGKLFHCHSGKQSKCPVVNFFIDIHNSDLDAIVTKCEYSFTCNCMEEIKAAIYRLTPPFKTSIEDVEHDKNKALFQLRYDKNMYEKEDKAWHEEQLAIARMNSVTKPASTQGGRR